MKDMKLKALLILKKKNLLESHEYLGVYSERYI